MGKLVILKFGEGSFEQGFPVTLQIGQDGFPPETEVTGKLPPAPELFESYCCWQSAYRSLGYPFRLEAFKEEPTNVSLIENCNYAAWVLQDNLNVWLRAESFRLLREKFLEKLIPSDEVRVLLQSGDSQIQRLPWHLWDLFDRYPCLEMALSASAYEGVTKSKSAASKVKILAILGNSVGIDTQTDRNLLEQLPDVEISWLVEPQRHEFTEQLWESSWDILFFAGHSSSQENSQKGQIHLNQQDSLTIDQLKYALKKAVGNGLRLAIFNSCDGIRLAWDLASLHIPQIIVMREMVPDLVAQRFLKYFLTAFAGGKSFYLSVREARERLEGLEGQFPCATWLPVIYQNPAEVLTTWHSLLGVIESVSRLEDVTVSKQVVIDNEQLSPAKTETNSVSSPRENLAKYFPKYSLLSRKIWRGCCLLFKTSFLVTALVIGVRWLGLLQPIELYAFDFLLRLRPKETTDSRLLVVTIAEADIQAQKQEPRQGSLSDAALEKLLNKLESYQPVVIGLDIYRDFPVNSNYPDLAQHLRHNNRFIATCKGRDSDSDLVGVPPPPEVPEARLGFSDFIEDGDGVLRRQLLFMTPEPISPCVAPYAFSVQLAFRYLAQEGILPTFTPEGNLQLGNKIFKGIKNRFGGYQSIDARGNQHLLNYRSLTPLDKIVSSVSLSDILSKNLNPDAVKGRIVLVGVSASSAGDYWATPYGSGTLEKIPGVFIQAHMISQILSAVLDQRPLLQVWSQWGEALWICGWSVIGGFLAWGFPRLIHLFLAGGTTILILFGLCLVFLVQGWWIPLVPSMLAMLITAGLVVSIRSKS